MRKNFFHRIIWGILYSRWEPVETVLSIHQLLVGLWLMFPYWQIHSFTGMGVANVPRWMEAGIGAASAISGALYLIILTKENFATGWRATVLLFMFMHYLMTAFLALQVTGVRGIRWTAFVALALLTAISYLSVTVGEVDE